MLDSFNFQDSIYQAKNAIMSVRETVPFIQENQLWRGFLENKWVLIVTVFISAVFSYFVFNNLFGGGSMDKAAELGVISQDMENLVSNAQNIGSQGSYSSGTKYLLLIFLEVVVFHFAVKSVSILKGKKKSPQFKDFMRAEKRMIVLLFISFIKGILANILLSIILSMLGYNDWTGFFMFFVTAYFIGFAFLDNYNEQFGKSLKTSLLIVRQHVGAATIIGIVISLLLMIPLVGPILAPILGAISATLYGAKYTIEDTEIVEVVK